MIFLMIGTNIASTYHVAQTTTVTQFILSLHVTCIDYRTKAMHEKQITSGLKSLTGTETDMLFVKTETNASPIFQRYIYIEVFLYVLSRRLGGQIFLQFLDMICSVVNYHLVKKSIYFSIKILIFIYIFIHSSSSQEINKV